MGSIMDIPPCYDCFWGLLIVSLSHRKVKEADYISAGVKRGSFVFHNPGQVTYGLHGGEEEIISKWRKKKPQG